MPNIAEILNNLSEEDLIDVLAQIDPVSWCEHVRTLRGEPFSLKDRKYLHDIYRDRCRTIVLLKGRQVEGTELTLNLILSFLAKNPYTTALHLQPRSQQAERFSKTRLSTAIAESKHLSEWESQQGSQLMLRKFERINKETKKVEYNYYALAGTMTSGSAEGGDAVRGLSTDMVALDEAQDMVADDLPTILEGMSHSKFKNKLILGTPKFTNDALWKNWEVSDMKEWFVPCECGYETMVRYDCIIDDGTDPIKPHYIYACDKCGKELDRRAGYWKPTNDNWTGDVSGYHLSQLIVPWITADEVKQKEADPNYSKRRFMNEVLGLAFVGEDMPMTVEQLKECTKGNDEKLGVPVLGERLFAGCDWGTNGSYCFVISDKYRLVDLFECHNKDTRTHPTYFAERLKKYRHSLSKIVCDYGSDVAYFYGLTEKCKENGIFAPVYACQYRTPPQTTEESWNEKTMVVSVGRSEIFEKGIDLINRCVVQIPQRSWEDEKVQKFVSHACNMATETRSTNAGVEFLLFIPLGDDHYWHCFMYSLLAMGNVPPPAMGTVSSGFVNQRRDGFDPCRRTSGTFLKANQGTSRVSQTARRTQNNRRRFKR